VVQAQHQVIATVHQVTAAVHVKEGVHALDQPVIWATGHRAGSAGKQRRNLLRATGPVLQNLQASLNSTAASGAQPFA
jgi:hypothetical protein